MFKKKSTPLFNEVDDSRVIVDNFRLRSSSLGFESYRTVEYRLYHKLDESEMLPKLDEHLDKLFNGSIDDANSNILDEIIIGTALEAFPDLERQHYDHTDMIRRLSIRHQADAEDIRRIKNEREDELHDIEEDHAKTSQMMAAYCKEDKKDEK